MLSKPMHQPKEIVEAALKLAPEQREEIINDLWASLDGNLGNSGRKRSSDGSRMWTLGA